MNQINDVPENTEPYLIGTELFFKNIYFLNYDYDNDVVELKVMSGIVLSVEKYRGSSNIDKWYIRYKTSHEHIENYGFSRPKHFNTIVYHDEVFLSEKEAINYILNNKIKKYEDIILEHNKKIIMMKKKLRNINQDN